MTIVHILRTFFAGLTGRCTLTVALTPPHLGQLLIFLHPDLNQLQGKSRFHLQP